MRPVIILDESHAWRARYAELAAGPEQVWGVARYDPDDQVVFGVDVAADPADRSLVFAQVRDGIVRVHVPEVR